MRRLFLQKGLTFPFVEGVEYSRKEGVVTHEDQRSGSRRRRDQKEHPLLRGGGAHQSQPGNGYRSYSQADVERLRRIKLLRKLDVPLAEIREMLEGQRTLAEGMSQQLERLRSRRADLEEAIGFCTLLQQENGPLEQLDVEQTLARLTAREEQGVTFVNIERTDQKTRRIRGACIGAALFVTMMAFVMAIMGWAVYTDPQDAPPLPLLVVMFGIPAGCIVGTLKVLLDRIEEIGKGEEDAYRNY